MAKKKLKKDKIAKAKPTKGKSAPKAAPHKNKGPSGFVAKIAAKLAGKGARVAAKGKSKAEKSVKGKAAASKSAKMPAEASGKAAAALRKIKGGKTVRGLDAAEKKAALKVHVVIPPSKAAKLGRGAPSTGAANGKTGKSAKVAKEAKKRCREPGCDQDPLLAGYCRLHYIKNWKKVKRKEAILATGQLNNYVEELVSKYPDKYLEVIRQDLASEKDWNKVIVDLELEATDDDTAGDEEMEGLSESQRREKDFDDDNDSF